MWPGPVQTVDYAAAVLERFERQRGSEASPAEILALAADRVVRWERSTVPTVAIVHQVAALTGGDIPADVMAGQARHAASLADGPGPIEVAVIPANSEALPLGAWSIYHTDKGSAIVVENLASPTTHLTGRAVEVYQARAAFLRSVAVTGAKARRLLTRAP